MKIAVLTDSGSGLSQKEAEDYGLFYLPLQIIDGETVYLDGYDITTNEIYEMIREEKMMKTSLPPMGMIEDLFKKLKKEGYDHVVNVPLNNGLSGTLQAIRMVAAQNDMPITSIDTYTTCFIQSYLARAAQKLVDEGIELDELIARLQDSVEHSNTLIIPDDLEHLKRGGRLTPLAAKLGGMLKIKPVLQLNKVSDGKIDTFAKVRTMSKAMKQAVDTFVKEGIEDDYMIAVLHTDAKEMAEELKTLYFEAYPNNDNEFGLIGPVISVHTGMGCLGIQYIKKV